MRHLALDAAARAAFGNALFAGAATLAVTAASTAAPPDHEATAPAAGVHGSCGGCGLSLRPEDVAAMLGTIAAGISLPAEALESEYVVPIAMHVVRRSDGTGGLSDEDLEISMLDLQLAFDGSPIRFCTPYSVDFIDSDWFYESTNTITVIDQLRTTNVVPGAINVYWTPNLALGGGSLQLCGISSFTSSPVQGIVMRNSCGAEGGNASTLAHEVGHYFNLLHTHETALGVECPDGSNCGAAGDLVCDTPADPRLGAHNVDPRFCTYSGDDPDPCDPFGLGYDPDPTNHMSYAPHTCRTTFTTQQISRMVFTLISDRPELAMTDCPDLSWEVDARLAAVNTRPDGAISEENALMPSLSGDGRLLVYYAEGDDIVPGDRNDRPDIVMVDLETDDRRVISLRRDGTPSYAYSRAPQISNDGSTIAYVTQDSEIALPGHEGFMAVQAVLHDVETGQVILASPNLNGGPADGYVNDVWISDDGRYALFATDAPDLVEGDTPNPYYGTDVFLFDSETRKVERISEAADGEEPDSWSGSGSNRASISDDGRFVAFVSDASNLVPNDANGWIDVFIRDRVLGTTRLVSTGHDGGPANGPSFQPWISPDGSEVIYSSSATNLVEGIDFNDGARDLFVHDVEAGTTSRIELAGGEPSTGFLIDFHVSRNGRWIGINSNAIDLDADVDPDADPIFKAFVHDRVSGRSKLVSPLAGPFPLSGWEDQASAPLVSNDGRTAIYSSRSRNIMPNDFDGDSTLFAFDTAIDPRDVDGDESLGLGDIVSLLAAWGPCSPSLVCPADVDGDGAVDLEDLLLVLAAIPAG